MYRNISADLQVELETIAEIQHDWSPGLHDFQDISGITSAEATRLLEDFNNELSEAHRSLTLVMAVLGLSYEDLTTQKVNSDSIRKMPISSRYDLICNMTCNLTASFQDLAAFSEVQDEIRFIRSILGLPSDL